MTAIDQAAIDSAVKALVAAGRVDDRDAVYRAVMPPAGLSTPPDEAAIWFGTLLIHMALTTAAASGLEQGCSREGVSRWISDVVGPAPTPALVRAEDPARIDHGEAVKVAADQVRAREYAVDLIRVGLTPPDQDPDPRAVDAHCEVTNDRHGFIVVTRLLARLAAAAGGRARMCSGNT